MANVMAVRSRPRIIIEWCIFFMMAAMFLETWLLSGVAVPRHVVGGSMAPSLLGIHCDVVCRDCGFPFSCGMDHGRATPRAVCPNCGCTDNNLGPLQEVPGDWIWIDRAAFALRPPRRWEVVAVRWPRCADAAVLKRVVGLPGEKVELRDGDVYIDGRIQRKNIEEQRALAVPVYDAACRPAQKSPPLPLPRWQAEPSRSSGGPWRLSNGGFMHPTGSADDPVDWLVYRHGRRTVDGSFVKSPVTDVGGYDPFQPRREEDVHAVADLILSFRLSGVSGCGTVYIRADDGSENFEARLHLDKTASRYQTLHNRQPVPNAGGNLSPGETARLVEVSLVDQQFLLVVNGQTVVQRPYDRARPAARPPTTPLAIGVRGLGVALDDLRVYRDAYYTRPVGMPNSPGAAGPISLRADEYFILGDNSPVSEDSRHWPPRGAIVANLLLGKPLLAIPAACASPQSPLHFHVPNLRGIRYIH